MKAQDIQEKFFRDGKLLVIPKKLKSKQVLFAYLQEELAKKGSTFTEKEVNAFLAEVYDDYATRGASSFQNSVSYELE